MSAHEGNGISFRLCSAGVLVFGHNSEIRMTSEESYILLKDPRRSLDVVEALDFVAFGRVKQTRQQILGHVHLKQENNELFFICLSL